MDQLLMQVVGGVIVAIIAGCFGIGGTTRVISHGTKIRRTGKWIILISVVMIFAGLAWMGNGNPQSMDDWFKPPAVYGFTLALYGFLFFFIGKVVAWFQKI